MPMRDQRELKTDNFINCVKIVTKNF